jgi:hypothetical protein
MDFTLGSLEGGGMYFSAYCEQAGADILLGSGNFVALVDGPHGTELHYRCHCGQTGVIYPKGTPELARG